MAIRTMNVCIGTRYALAVTYALLLLTVSSVLIYDSSEADCEGDTGGAKKSYEPLANSNDSGEGIIWDFDEGSGTLTISGSGPISEDIPSWVSRDSIKTVVIKESVTSIGDSVFSGCSNLGTISITAPLTSIGEGTFRDCSALTSVTFPDSLESIGNEAFRDCTSLTSLTLPDSLYSVGDSAFNGCIRLNVISIPISLDTVGSNDDPAFSGCNNIEKITFTKGSGSWYEYGRDRSQNSYYGYAPWFEPKADLKIIFSDEIISLRGSIFNDCTHLKALSIPISLDTVGSDDSPAFSGCVNIREITFTEGTGDWYDYSRGTDQSQGSYYKYTPWNLTQSNLTVNLSDGIDRIGQYAFYDCSNIDEIYFDDTSLKFIENNAFESCSALTSINIPDSVIYIHPFAFKSCDALESATIGKSVTTIGGGAFAFCSSLTSVSIPDSVLYLEEYAFGGCSNLHSATIGKSVTSIGEGTFFGCSSLASVSIPDSVIKIGGSAFNLCSSLSEAYIGNSVNSIGDYAFASCSKLTLADLPDSVISIGNFAFYNCSSLSSSTLGKSVMTIGEKAYYSCTSLTHVTIPETVESVGNQAFANCTQITRLIIDSGCAKLGVSVFENCTNLKTLSVPISLDTVVSNDNLTFYGCYNIEEITFTAGSGVWYDYGSDKYSPSYYGYAPWFLSKLDLNLIFSDEVPSLKLSIFNNCTNLKTLSIPISLDTVVSNYEPIFSGCTNIEEITFTKGTGEWFEYSFDTSEEHYFGYTPWNLTNANLVVNISETVFEIGPYAFYSCTKIQGVNFLGTGKSIEEGAFEWCKSLKTVNMQDSVVSIGPRAFRLCLSLQSVTLGNSVITVGDAAFANCSALTSVVMSDSVTTIGGAAFYFCNSLSSLTIGASVTSIGDDAFNYCTSLTSVTIPDSVNYLGIRAFADCTGLTDISIPTSLDTVVSNDSPAFSGCTKIANITFTAGSGDWYPYSRDSTQESYYEYTPWNITESELTINITEGVDKVSEYAFYNCASLLSVAISDSVTMIGDEAFAYCSTLSTLTIGKSVLTIGDGVFNRCGKLTAVTIPDSVTSIGNEAFAYCSTLSTLTIGNSVISIGDDAFYRCGKLTSVTIPDSVTSIGDEAFYQCSDISTLIIGNSVKSIGDNVFYSCGRLTAVTIPDSVTSIGDYAFRDCSSLSELNLGNSVKTIGNHAFESCTSLTSLTIPGSVTRIGSDTFKSCASLATVVIPDSVTSIGSGAFSGCILLTNLTIPISLNAVGSNNSPAFSGCTKIANITFTASSGDWYPYSRDSSQESYYKNTPWNITESELTINISEGVDKVGEYAFYNCASLLSVAISDSVTSIGDDAFANCTTLSTLTIGNSVLTIGDDAFYRCGKLTSVTIPDSVTSIGDEAFYQCSDISTLIIGKSVLTIGEDAFNDCGRLTAVTIPDSVTSIGSYAFRDCSSLSELNLGKSVKTIGNQAFGFCTSLTSAIMPCSVTRIGTEAFYYCTSLTTVIIPDSVTSMGKGAFSGCIILTNLTIPISLDAVASNSSPAFSGCTKITEITFTAGSGDWYPYSRDPSQESYYKNTPWYLTKTRLTIYTDGGVDHITDYAFYECTSLNIANLEGVASIGDHAFDGCENLKSVSDMEEVESIGDYAFYLCMDLKSVSDMADVESIGDYAFFNCNKLSSVVMSDTITTIGTDAFYHCAFTAVVIPDSVTSIGIGAFSFCSYLTSADIGKSLPRIGDKVFANCSSLSSVTMWEATSVSSSAFKDCGDIEFVIKPVYYTITFMSDDQVIQTLEVRYNTLPEYTGNTPTKEATAQYSYTFKGWSPEVVKATGNATYVAEFTETLREYTITFVNDDQVLQQTQVPYGIVPGYDGKEPTKEATAQYTFKFKGWDSEIVAVTGEATYTAVFDETVNRYAIRFMNDGTELLTLSVEYGTVPEYTGQTPTKEATTEHSYKFSGWSPEIVKVTGNATYAAEFTETLREYTITFMNGDQVLQQTQIPYGIVPGYDGEAPTKESTAQYAYEFKGWSPEIAKVTGNATYAAEFTEAPREYTVTFMNDEVILQQTQVPYGTVPEYTGQIPTKESTAQYTYAFNGWNRDLVAVTGDTVYKAVFTETLRDYTVEFRNGEDIIKKLTVPYGETPVYSGAEPTKEATAEHSYKFRGWEPEIVAVTENATYTAVFDELDPEPEPATEFTITFVNGEIIEKITVHEGELPKYPRKDPTKESTAQYTYEFKGWSPEIVEATGNATYVAEFTETLREYTITFMNGDKTLQQTPVPYGTVPKYDGTEPTREPTEQYSFTFNGWDRDFVAVTEDASYNAEFTVTLRNYTIKFVNGGDLLRDLVLPYGDTPAYSGAEPTRESTVQYSYKFKGWSPNIVKVTGDTTYFAEFTETPLNYTITFKNGDDVLQTLKVPYGDTPVYTGQTPTKEATTEHSYKFSGWSPEIVKVTGNATYVAEFTETLREYTVTFKNGNQVLQQTQVPYGTAPEYGGKPPTREPTEQYSYTFNGWDREIVAVTGDATYSAEFTETLRRYTITFMNGDKTLQQTKVLYGDTPAYSGAEPTKEATTEYTYKFKGWDSEIVAVTGDAVYSAVFDETANKYTVRFVNDVEELLTISVEYGAVPAYTGQIPTKESTAQYTFKFKGWSPEVVKVTGDATYSAQFAETPREYTITFMNGDQVLQQTQVPYGTVPEYAGENPTKADSDLCTYIFVGWGPMVVSVVGDAAYTAVFISYPKDAKTAVIEAEDYVNITVTKDAMDRIGSDLDKGIVDSLIVKLNTGFIIIGPQAASGIKGESTFSIIQEIHPVIPSGAQKLIGDRPVYDIIITSADGSIHQFNGDLTISVKYELRDSEDAKDICIVYLKDDGTYSTVDATYSDGYVTFTADHLSSYAVAFKETDTNPAGSHTDNVIICVILTVIILLSVGVVIWKYTKHKC